MDKPKLTKKELLELLDRSIPDDALINEVIFDTAGYDLFMGYGTEFIKTGTLIEVSYDHK